MFRRIVPALLFALASAWGAPPPTPRPAADDFLVSRFETADVVLLSEDHRARQNLEFVHELIPKLHAAGVRTLVMEFRAALIFDEEFKPKPAYWAIRDALEN